MVNRFLGMGMSELFQGQLFGSRPSLFPPASLSRPIDSHNNLPRLSTTAPDISTGADPLITALTL
jgi:hypothetical protein